MASGAGCHPTESRTARTGEPKLPAGRRRHSRTGQPGAELFEKQPASEKRRLLDFVLSNSTWGDGQLTVEFRQPFDLIALGATELKQKKAAGVGSDDLYQF